MATGMFKMLNGQRVELTDAEANEVQLEREVIREELAQQAAAEQAAAQAAEGP